MRNTPFGFGIEEEYFLGDAATRQIAREVSPDLLAAARERLGDVVTTEMLQSQIEIASPVFTSADEALATLRRYRRALAAIAGDAGLRLIAAGTHPMGHWGTQAVTQRPRYSKVLADFRIVGQRNLICGMHVHVGVPEGLDRVVLMNRLMPWLPMFLALSCSSPFWERRITGLASYRQSLFDEWPRSGIPDFFDDEADYDAFAALLAEVGAAADSSYLWWAIRPSLRFPTLELRICDICTRPAQGVALASLFRCLVAAMATRPELATPRSTHTRRIIDENRWRAKRDGIGAKLIDEHARTTVAVPDLLARLRSALEPEIARFGCAREIDLLERMATEGTSARAQLLVYNEARAAGAGRHDALCRVVDWLAETTLS